MSPVDVRAVQEVFDPVVNVLRALSANGCDEISLNLPEMIERNNLAEVKEECSANMSLEQ